MENTPRIIKLSKYFDENVQLVAGICPKCYAESSDVKITAVNRKFLKITNQHHLLENILTVFTKDGGNLSENSRGGDKIDLLDSFEKSNNRNSCFGGRIGKEIEIKHTNVNFNKENCEDMILQYVNNNNNLNLKENQIFNSDNTKIKINDQTKFPKQNNFLDETGHNINVTSCTKTVTSKYFLRKNNKDNKSDDIKDMEQGIRNREKVIKFDKISTNKQVSETKTKSADTELTLENDIVPKTSIYFLRKHHNVDKTKSLKRKPNVFYERRTSSDENCSKLCVEDHQNIPLSQCVLKALTDEEIIDPASCSFCQVKILQISTQSSTTSLNDLEEKYKIYEPKMTSWMPPKSPHNLIEECLSHDPWALLIATIFLNKTSCMVARQYVEEFLQDNPNPYIVLKKDSSELVKYFVNLGLHQRRAEQVWKMSHDFIHKKWKKVGELYGIGQYGEDAYRMFCLGDMTFRPSDRFLRIYRNWYKMNFSQRDGSFFKLHHSENSSLSENSD